MTSTMNTSARVAVVVVSYNTRDLLLECLASVFESARETSVEVVCVDNASTDGSYEAVRAAYGHSITIIKNSTNLGFAAACNQGIRATSAPFLLLVNSDARINARALEVLLSCVEETNRCGAAGCRVINTQGVGAVSTRNFLTPLNQALETAGIRLGLPYIQRTRRPVLNERLADCEIDWIDGSCLMLSRAALDEVGYLDERFFMYSEDEDLCFRLKQRGWLVCFCAEGTIVHHGARSSEQARTEMLRHFYESQMRFLASHRGRGQASLYASLLKLVLGLKRLLLPDRKRREKAQEQLTALTDAAASRAWCDE